MHMGLLLIFKGSGTRSGRAIDIEAVKSLSAMRTISQMRFELAHGVEKLETRRAGGFISKSTESRHMLMLSEHVGFFPRFVSAPKLARQAPIVRQLCKRGHVGRCG